MVNLRTDYTTQAVEAARSVMMELVRLLGEYRDDMVIIGGWVPDLLVACAEHEAHRQHRRGRGPESSEDHGGGLSHDPRTPYRGGDIRRGDQPYVFYRTVVAEGQEIKVRGRPARW